MFSEEGCPYWKLDVPQQTNSSDCGLFMLHSIEQFIRDPSAVRATPSPGETLCGFDSGVFGIGALAMRSSVWRRDAGTLSWVVSRPMRIARAQAGPGSTGLQVLLKRLWYQPQAASNKRTELKRVLVCLSEEASTRVKYAAVEAAAPPLADRATDEAEEAAGNDAS